MAKKEKRNLLKQYVSFIFKTLSINWLSLILINILVIIESFIGSIVMANISKYIIDNVFVNQRFTDLKYIIPVYGLCYLINLILNLISAYLLIQWKIKIDYQLKNKFYARMTDIKYQKLEKINSSELYYRMFEDGAFMSGYVYILCIVLPSSLLCVVIILYTLFTWSIPLTIYTFILIIGELINLMFIRRPLEKINLRQKKINQFIINFILEKLEYIDQTKAGNFKEWWIQKVYEEFEHAKKITKDNQFKNTILGKIINFFQEFWTVGFLILGGFLAVNNLCTVGLFFSFQSLINYLLVPLTRIFDGVFLFQETKVSFGRYMEYYNLPLEEKEGREFCFKSKFEIRDINFRYDSNSSMIFNNFTLKLKPNTLIGIKGESGSGKTTLLKICARLLDIESGGIYIDDININDIAIRSFRNNFNFMLQSSVIFEDTFTNNITLGEKIEEEEIIKIIYKCHLQEVVNKLPDGINSVVGKGGVQFSKGEVQRIALARILIKKPSIIWLDEPTASLDELTEKYIIETIINLRQETSCLIIINTHSKNLLSCVDHMIEI